MYTTSLIRRHISSLPARTIFVTRDLLVYGKRNAVDQALFRLVKTGLIRRLARGVFVREGTVPASFSSSEIATAKAAAFGKRLVAHPDDLARTLGLVAGESKGAWYSTSGRTSSFRTGTTVIHMRQAGPRHFVLSERKGGDFIRALWHSRGRLTAADLDPALRTLGRRGRHAVLLASPWAPAWLHDSFNRPYVPADAWA